MQGIAYVACTLRIVLHTKLTSPHNTKYSTAHHLAGKTAGSSKRMSLTHLHAGLHAGATIPRHICGVMAQTCAKKKQKEKLTTAVGGRNRT
jgi:hypothetical protein